MLQKYIDDDTSIREYTLENSAEDHKYCFIFYGEPGLVEFIEANELDLPANVCIEFIHETIKAFINGISDIIKIK